MKKSKDKRIKSIYHILLNQYGSQGWWPLTAKNKLIPEHSGKKPGTEQQGLEIILGAILTQNTSWKNAEKAIVELNKRKLIDKSKLESLPAKKLGTVIKSSGYYNQKAKKIKAMMRFLDSGKPVSRKNLLRVWGIGPETADSILLYAYEHPFFVVDTYTLRVFSRLGMINSKRSYDEVQQLFHENLGMNINLFKEYHALIVEHCKRFCRKKPLCNGCVLRKLCQQS